MRTADTSDGYRQGRADATGSGGKKKNQEVLGKGAAAHQDAKISGMCERTKDCETLGIFSVRCAALAEAKFHFYTHAHTHLKYPESYLVHLFPAPS